MDKKIIVVDESITLQKVISLILKKQAYSLSFYTKGKTALEAIIDEKPNLVIADVSVEDLNAYEIGKKMQEDPETKEIPLILTHSSFIEIDDELYRQSGAVSVLSKPFEEKNFLKMVRKYIEGIKAPYEDKGEGFFVVEDDEEIEEMGLPDIEEKNPLDDIDDIQVKSAKEEEKEETLDDLEDIPMIDDSVITENLSDEEAEKLLREFNLKENRDGTINFDKTNPSIEEDKKEDKDIWEEEKLDDDIPVERNVDDKMIEDITREEVRRILPGIIERIVKEELDKII